MTYEEAVAWMRMMHEARTQFSPDGTTAFSDTLAVLEREHEEAEKFRALEARAVTNGTLKVVINDTIMGLGAARKGVSDEYGQLCASENRLFNHGLRILLDELLRAGFAVVGTYRVAEISPFGEEAIEVEADTLEEAVMLAYVAHKEGK